MTQKPFETVFGGPGESPGFLLWQVSNLWQRQQRAALKGLDLTHVQFVLLAGLTWQSHGQPGLTQAELAQHTQVDVMMTSQVLRALEQKGLVERTPHPRDTRANLVRPTAAGQTLVAQAIQVVEGVDQRFFNILGNDVLQLVRLLHTLLPNPLTADEEQHDASIT